MTRATPREVIADWLWNEADKIDFDDMGSEAGMQIVRKLEAAGYIIVRSGQKCPFGKGQKNELRPEDPCPVCGDLGTFDDVWPSRCID